MPQYKDNVFRLFLVLILTVMVAQPAMAYDYPGVFTSEDSLIFIQSSNQTGGVDGIVVLSYEYSMDWIITVGTNGMLTPDGLLITDGHQYVYNADGTRSSEIEFRSIDRTVDWSQTEFHVLPSYGRFLAPMVRGGLAYALVETRAGLPSQIVLAREAYEVGEKLNLFEGFLYQISQGELTAQMAFTEVAFGSQGLVRGNFPADFPPPPEDYPIPYPVYSQPGYYPQGQSQGSTGSSGGGYMPFTGTNLPYGTEVPPEEMSNRPRFTLNPIYNYDVPKITRIGLVSFRAVGDMEEQYMTVSDDLLSTALGNIDGMEVVYIPFDSDLLGGAVIYDRAVWLCEYYGVQALMMNQINKIDIPGGIAVARSAGTFRVNISLSSKLIDGYGGRTIWDEKVDYDKAHDYFEADSGVENVIKGNLFQTVRSLISRLTGSGVLEGGHYE